MSRCHTLPLTSPSWLSRCYRLHSLDCTHRVFDCMNSCSTCYTHTKNSSTLRTVFRRRTETPNLSIAWRPTPEKNNETMPCWGKKNSPEKCLVDLGRDTRTSTQSRRLVSEERRQLEPELAFWSEFASAYAVQILSLCCASVTTVYLFFLVIGRFLTGLDRNAQQISLIAARRTRAAAVIIYQSTRSDTPKYIHALFYE